MGFLRKKVVRGVDYYLWCERKREGKKKGGDGKVKSREITLGKNPYFGEWIAAYAFLGYLPIKQFLQNVASWRVKREIRLWELFFLYFPSNKVSFQLRYHADSKPPKIAMRGKRGIDLRTKIFRRSRDSINRGLYLAWKECYLFDNEIESIKRKLETAKFYDSLAEDEKQRINDPYDEESRAHYQEWLHSASENYSEAQMKIDSLVEQTPRKYQDEMRGKLERIIFQR